MYILKGEKNTNFLYEPHLDLQDTSESINEKEAGKAGAEFPPNPLSAPAAILNRPLGEKRRNDLYVLLSHLGCWVESLQHILVLYLRNFLKESSNFGQKAQPLNTTVLLIS